MVLALARATCVLATVYELSSTEVAKAIEILLDHRDLTLQDPDTGTRRSELSTGISAKLKAPSDFRIPTV